MNDREKLEIALSRLANLCVAVDVNGTECDDWDEHYKDAMYRPTAIREDLDAAIAQAREACGLVLTSSRRRIAAKRRRLE